MTMRERMARVLLEAKYGKNVATICETDKNIHWRDNLRYADAVLQAMREPTQEMVDAGLEAIARDLSMKGNTREPRFRLGFAAAIDSALSQDNRL